MPGVGTLTISGTISGLPGGSRTVSLPIALSAAIDASQSIVLASGFNQIAVPTGARLCIIVPPTANATTLTLKGVTGDTGIPLHPATPTMLALAAGDTTIGITAGGLLTAATEFLFF